MQCFSIGHHANDLHYYICNSKSKVMLALLSGGHVTLTDKMFIPKIYIEMQCVSVTEVNRQYYPLT